MYHTPCLNTWFSLGTHTSSTLPQQVTFIASCTQLGKRSLNGDISRQPLLHLVWAGWCGEKLTQMWENRSICAIERVKVAPRVRLQTNICRNSERVEDNDNEGSSSHGHGPSSHLQLVISPVIGQPAVWLPFPVAYHDRTNGFPIIQVKMPSQFH